MTIARMAIATRPTMTIETRTRMPHHYKRVTSSSVSPPTRDQDDFGPNAMHQPFGLIVPSTILQAFGASQFTQIEHF